MSQPNPRRTCAEGGCSGVVIFSTISGGNTVLPASRAWANFDKSSAVENNPACPATPPMRRAVGSCTTPRSILLFSSYWVGAIFGRQAAGGRKRVCVIFSGLKMFFSQYWSSVVPEMCSTSAPSVMKLMSL